MQLSLVFPISVHAVAFSLFNQDNASSFAHSSTSFNLGNSHATSLTIIRYKYEEYVNMLLKIVNLSITYPA